MSKGLNPQDVANALPTGCKFISMDEDGEWFGYLRKPVKGVGVFGMGYAMPLNLKIDFDGDWEDSVFEKQEEFEDGELVIAKIFYSGVYTAERFLRYGKVYAGSVPTGDRSASGITAENIRKYKGNESLLGTEVK